MMLEGLSVARYGTNGMHSDQTTFRMSSGISRHPTRECIEQGTEYPEGVCFWPLTETFW